MSPDTMTNQDMVYCNGIDPDTGTYALPPFAIDDLAKNIRSRPGTPEFLTLHGEAVTRSLLRLSGWTRKNLLKLAGPSCSTRSSQDIGRRWRLF